MTENDIRKDDGERFAPHEHADRLGFTPEAVEVLNRYQQWVVRTKASDETLESQETILTAAALGLAGEAGEVADQIKKILFHKHVLTNELTRKLGLEVGDLLWYLALLAEGLGFELGELLASNINKLEDRYPSGFSSSASRARYADQRAVDAPVSTPPSQPRTAEDSRGWQRHRRPPTFAEAFGSGTAERVRRLRDEPDRSSPEFAHGFAIPQDPRFERQEPTKGIEDNVQRFSSVESSEIAKEIEGLTAKLMQNDTFRMAVQVLGLERAMKIVLNDSPLGGDGVKVARDPNAAMLGQRPAADGGVLPTQREDFGDERNPEETKVVLDPETQEPLIPLEVAEIRADDVPGGAE